MAHLRALYPTLDDKDRVEPCENRRGRGRTATFVRWIDRPRPRPPRRRRRFHLARNALSRTSRRVVVLYSRMEPSVRHADDF